MASVLERKLIVVTGKGGVGKTTVSAALGLLAARRGLRTIVVEVVGGSEEDAAAGTGRLAALLGHGVGGHSIPPPHGVEVELQEGQLWGLSIDRDRVLAEWLRAIGGRVPARVLTSSSSFQYLIAAAPGTREMISMVKVWELAAGRRPADRSRGGKAGADDYDLVILDAPATGHALAMLRAPRTYATIARMGPIARQSQQVRELLEDPERSAYIVVAHASEMAVTETLELRQGLRRELGRELDAVVVNGALPRRFEGGELQRIAALNGTPLDAAPAGPSRARTGRSAGAETRRHAVTRSAVRAAHAVHERARSQQSQIARLRRDAGPSGPLPVLSVPFLFRSELDLEALQRIADRLERGLER
ncbi:MAG: ArsA family ATPase [Solirubrobacterales bacterium]